MEYAINLMVDCEVAIKYGALESQKGKTSIDNRHIV